MEYYKETLILFSTIMHLPFEGNKSSGTIFSINPNSNSAFETREQASSRLEIYRVVIY